MKKSALLLADAAVNLILGAGLLLFPEGLAVYLGLPIPESAFYSSLLGAVLFGVGLALLLEVSRPIAGLAGLGLGGAIVINICGASALAYWLVSGKLPVTTPGRVLLYIVVSVVFVLAILETAAFQRRDLDGKSSAEYEDRVLRSGRRGT